jgi:hypothetical protein
MGGGGHRKGMYGTELRHDIIWRVLAGKPVWNPIRDNEGSGEMIYYQSGWAIVGYDASIPCVVIEWTSPATSEQFREALEKTYQAFLEFRSRHKHLYWLADTRKFNPVSSKDVRWVNTDLDSRLYQAGLRYKAFVVPENVIAKMSINSYRKGTESGRLQTGYFESLDKAREWLKSLA